MKELELQKQGFQPDAPAGHGLAAMAPGDDGSVRFLFAKTTDVFSRVTLQTGVSLACSQLPAPVSFVAADPDGNTWDLGDLDFAHPVFDRLPDGGFVVAASRCRWRGPDDYERNGALVSGDGRVSRFTPGDGIEALQADRMGRVWVSYFDEGVFGNRGWGRGGAPKPVGASGLVAFDPSGARVWENTQARIDSCYALNVTSDAVWFYAYRTFDLCKIAPDLSTTFWRTGLMGCRALAVADDRALFSGQYKDPPDRFWLLDLTREDATAVPVTVRLERGQPFQRGNIRARGEFVHVMSGGTWYRGALSDL